MLSEEKEWKDLLFFLLVENSNLKHEIFCLRCLPRMPKVFCTVKPLQRQVIEAHVVGHNKNVCSLVPAWIHQLGILLQEDVSNQQPLSKISSRASFEVTVIGLDLSDVRFKFW